MNHQIKVSIIIPTYNRSHLLMETLESVQAQSLQDWECLIVDDGGNDDTEEEVSKLNKKDNRFKYYKRPLEYPKGASNCRNFGFSLSSGNYIQWLDDDDILSKRKLEFQVNALEQTKNHFIFASCEWDLLWPGKKLELKNCFPGDEMLKENFFRVMADRQNFIPSLAYLVSRKLHIAAGNWNTELSINQDAEYFTRILIKSEKLINVKDCYVLYREHDAGRISRKRTPENMMSFFLSLELMQSYLKFHNINARSYFRWKLLKWLLAYYSYYPEIMNQYYHLFKENGIDLKWYKFYAFKHRIYRSVYPVYKQLKS
ncbi:glycosyltransferase family 2 protein [Autumnicola musiva]|uniref:Glycosyltransferase family 2 protein n=1 Tax=Autumnicola musiva TaxID=3075589 RepID=A0ABU3D5I5_9FLAO|nr:glycosyltransferase family 2 protein [Zunongwangia sp. F117]MDT0676799.1 glycosyltransferase family 2 protein [Zunongwangia sp. F117]